MPPPINKKDGELALLASMEMVGTTCVAIGPVTDVEVADGLFVFGAAVALGAVVALIDDAVVAVGCAVLEVASVVGIGVFVKSVVAVGKIGVGVRVAPTGGIGVKVAPTAGGGGTGVSVGSFSGLGVLVGFSSEGVLVGFPPCGVRVGTV